MMELRWKITALVRCDPDDNGIYGSRRTLQYRSVSRWENHDFGALVPIWNEWQDVPEFATDTLGASLER